MADDDFNIQQDEADNSAVLEDPPSGDRSEITASEQNLSVAPAADGDSVSEALRDEFSNLASDSIDSSPTNEKMLNKAEMLKRAYEIQTRRRLERQEREKQEEIEREKNRIVQQRVMREQMAKLEENSRQNAIRQNAREKEEHLKERRRQEELLKLDWKERFGTSYEEKSGADTSEAGGPPAGLKGRQLVAFFCSKLLAENKSADRPALRKCLTTLKLYIGNILSAPSDPKYKKIKKANQTFSNYVTPFVGGVDLLHSIGFEDTGDGFLVLNKTPDLFLMENAIRYLDVQIDKFKF